MPSGRKREFLAACMPTLTGTSCAQIFEPPWLTALQRSMKSGRSIVLCGSNQPP